jgi:hypothetical protein
MLLHYLNKSDCKEFLQSLGATREASVHQCKLSIGSWLAPHDEYEYGHGIVKVVRWADDSGHKPGALVDAMPSLVRTLSTPCR